MGPYLGILALMGIAATLCVVFATISWLLGPKRITSYKSSPYECGVEPIGDARERFPIRFYLVAIIFILFDIEAIFLWAWFTVYKNEDLGFLRLSFFEFLSYMLTWILAYAYVMRVGAIDWEESNEVSSLTEHAEAA